MTESNDRRQDLTERLRKLEKQTKLCIGILPLLFVCFFIWTYEKLHGHGGLEYLNKQVSSIHSSLAHSKNMNERLLDTQKGLLLRLRELEEENSDPRQEPGKLENQPQGSAPVLEKE